VLMYHYNTDTTLIHAVAFNFVCAYRCDLLSVKLSVVTGVVKKIMSDETGLKAEEQRVIYKGKERENGEYLDVCGVKDKSKLVLIQDASSIERRFIQMRINAKIQTANRAINNVSLQLDQLAEQVSAIEKSISDGVKVPEVQIITLIEMLMKQAIRLESISAEGDASAQKILQVFPTKISLCAYLYICFNLFVWEGR
jgi:hypothetical protein